MLKSYFKTAWRNFTGNKTHSFINLAGLSAGMAVAMLIGLWVWDEFSFNKNFDHYSTIAQVVLTETLNGEAITGKGNAIPLADELRKNYRDDVKYVVLSSWSMNSLVSAGSKQLSTHGNYMETDAPDMLSLHMLSGSRKAFERKSTILLSQSTAIKLFGHNDPVGKQVKIDGNLTEEVAGVYEDFPAGSSFQEVQFIAPFYDLTSWVNGNENDWHNESFQVFVQTKDKAALPRLSQSIKNIKQHKIEAGTARLENPVLSLHPMSRWHLYDSFENGVSTGGAIRYVKLFAITGIFVLLLACINFMNLSTARSEKRAREVGIRKAVGSMRIQLVIQFFGESLLVALLAFAAALLLVFVLLPFFNQMAGKQISLPLQQPVFWLISLAFTLFTGLLAGIYPSLYLSSFRPVQVLKGTLKAGRFASMPRKILVVTQFTVSIILIAGTVIVFKQVQYAQSRPTGYNRQGLVTLIMKTWNYHTHFESMRNELLQQGWITAMAESNTPVTENDQYNNGFSWEGITAQNSTRFNIVRATADYGKTVGFEITAGRDFNSNTGADANAIVLNTAAAKYMGFTDPIGKIIRQSNRQYQVIGVVKDVLMESPYDPVQPTLFMADSSIGGIVNLRLNPARSTAAALAGIEAVCKKYSPEEPFDYQFADDTFARKFAGEVRVGNISTCFALLAIFISCLGIFGMASFIAEQRIREIGIRKVMGASVFNIWQLLSREFVILVTIALLIATPAAYYAMYTWLQRYQYRTGISWWIFITAGTGAMAITLLTVSFQSLRAALANPVKSLKSE